VGRTGFSLAQGATLELEFRLLLTRSDRQRFQACLVRKTPGEDADSLPPVGAGESDGGFCFLYPVGELERIRPDHAALYFPSSGRRDGAPLPADVDPATWTRLTLQARPDGAVQAYLDGTLWVEGSERLRIRDAEPWQVAIMGAAVDTELLIRDLTVWRGIRYYEPGADSDTD
jgi:hypothetical protein